VCLQTRNYHIGFEEVAKIWPVLGPML
jgi:hypothetical protein